MLVSLLRAVASAICHANTVVCATAVQESDDQFRFQFANISELGPDTWPCPAL